MRAQEGEGSGSKFAIVYSLCDTPCRLIGMRVLAYTDGGGDGHSGGPGDGSREFRSYDKTYGKSLEPANVHEGLTAFLHNGRELRVDVVGEFLEQLEVRGGTQGEKGRRRRGGAGPVFEGECVRVQHRADVCGAAWGGHSRAHITPSRLLIAPYNIVRT